MDEKHFDERSLGWKGIQGVDEDAQNLDEKQMDAGT